jgi:phenylacetate-coenzyme A ligase PaaK-like adenylate-forming protein
MRNHFWQGETITHDKLLTKLETIEASIETVLVEDFDLDLFIETCDSFSKDLKSDSAISTRLSGALMANDGLDLKTSKEILNSIADFISKKQIKFKISNELGSLTPFTSKRINTETTVFEKWEPLGLVVQVLSGNDYALPVLSAFEGLMTGNMNVLKLSHQSSSFTLDFFTEFSRHSQTGRWKNRISLVNISSKEKPILEKLYAHADGVVVWGGEESINEIKKSVPSSARFIDWGHKISFSYFTKSLWQQPGAVEKLAHDISVFNQQACSSPQCVYLEDADFKDLKKFSELLGQAMSSVVSKYPNSEPSEMETAEITKVGLITKTEKSLSTDFTDVVEDKNGQWRIWIDSRTSLRASPLYKTIWVKPIQRSAVLKTLRPMKQYLQTVGLSCEISDLFQLTRLFYSCGVTRIRSNGSMQDSYMGEPHDGYFALNRYVRRVSLESDIATLTSFSTIHDLKENKIHFAQFPEKLMDKVDFQNIPDQSSSQLYFKSGGSSGVSKISQFTYVDYHTQMRAAANGLMAAGLDPQKDRSMNLFFGGGLYGGFLSFFTILEELKAVQFPMSAYMDYDFVGQIIRKYNVNVLMGMPSYLMQLLEHNKQWIIQDRLIEKIFYGGEAFSSSQIEKLKNEYGIKVIKSASYGSVDMGPLGYQCPHSDNKTYHLHHNIHHLEILNLESTNHVSHNEIGRLVFSTHSREDQSLLRYDVGDLGKWVKEPCPCGRKSPRFELLGRYGDIFRAAGSFLNYNHIASLLSEKLGVASEFQIVLKKTEAKEQMTLLISCETDSSGALAESDFLRSLNVRGMGSLADVTAAFLDLYYDLHELVHYEKVLDVKIDLVPSDSLQRSAASGKLLHIIDQRSLS